MEGRGWRAEGGGQKAEGRGQRAREGGGYHSWGRLHHEVLSNSFLDLIL